MASTSTNPGDGGPPRRLSELLDEQQEPFVLEIYLLERGYRVQRSLEFEDSRTSVGCCSGRHDYSKDMMMVKKSEAMNHSTRLSDKAKSFLSRLVSKKKKPRKRREKGGVGSTARRPSVSSSTTLSNNTWSDSDTDGELISMSPLTNEKAILQNESAGGRVMNQWTFDNEQCSPDSVLDEIDLLQSFPVYNVNQSQEVSNVPESRIRFQKKVTGDAILSASLWELLVQFTGAKPKQQEGRRKPFPEFMNSKKALQKNRQLLFDCVREAVETGNQLKSNFSNREKGLKMGAEEIGKNICNSLKVWGKLSADEPNIQKEIRRELIEGGAADQWSSFDVWKKDIAAEMGDGIFDEITDKLISDMID